MNALDAPRGELIGLQCRVSASANASFVGLEGLVVDETQGTLTLELPGPSQARERIVPKAGQRFTFTLPDGSISTLEGRSLAFRPEDRIRKAAALRGANVIR